MGVLRIAGPAVLVVCLWSVWERRATFGSRFDAAGSVSVLLFGIGSAFDAPWWGSAEALHALTGRYYVLTLIGGLCYVVGGTLVVKVIYLRLLSDEVNDVFFRSRIAPAVCGAAAVMVVGFTASSVPLTLSAVHPYLIVPDGWMTVHWLAHFGTTTILGIIASVGVYRLRPDPRAFLLNVGLAVLLGAAMFGGVVGGYGVISGRIETFRLVAWLLTYVAFAIAAVVAAMQWRHRVSELLGSRIPGQ